MLGTLGNIGMLQEGEATFAYHLERAAEQVEIGISDAHGRIVYRSGGTKLAGRNIMTWNGKSNTGEPLPDGAYRITVKARDREGRPVAAKTYTTGRVAAGDMNGSGGLMFGRVLVPFDRMLAIREPINA